MQAATKEEGPWLMMATSSGLGKRVPLSEFRITGRGARGVRAIRLAENASVVSMHVVDGHDKDEVAECLVATASGMMSKIPLEDLRVYSRAARGLRVVRLRDADKLQSLTPCMFRHYHS
jgi:DNA gyrase subunit A